MTHFPGVLVAIITPMDSHHEVDVAGLKEHVDWLIQEGVDGIIPTGSLGEYATMTSAERALVVEAAIDAAGGRVPVVVGSAAPSTKMAVEWAAHAKRSGADGIMALPPINYKPSEAEVVAHYEALSQVGIPIIAYNNPRDYPTDLTPALLKRLSAIDAIVGVKEFTGDIRRVHDILRETDLEVLIGVDDVAMEGGLAGATGWIAGVTNILPRDTVRMFKLAQAGELQESLALYRRMLPLFHWDASPRLVQAIKYGMELAGRSAGGSRPPRLALTEEERRDVQAAFAYAIGRD